MSETASDAEPDEAPPQRVVLELRNVTFASRTENSIRLRKANLVVREGELVMLRINRAANCRDVVSMLQGLQAPREGEVLFENQDWRGEDFSRHFRMRSRIGRVFEDHAWIQNFNVFENVTLASRHHRPSDKTINDQVHSWANRFDVAAVSRSRPSFVNPSVLQVYQWIRALIGKPALLVLERPMKSVPMTRLSKLVEVINEVRQAGAAVVWFTSNTSDLSDKFAAPRIDYQLDDETLKKVSGDSRDE